jgi:hypothetical protein
LRLYPGGGIDRDWGRSAKSRIKNHSKQIWIGNGIRNPQRNDTWNCEDQQPLSPAAQRDLPFLAGRLAPTNFRSQFSDEKQKSI